MATGSREHVFTSRGFELYLPPTPFRSRFVMLDESNDVFYEVDCQTSRTSDEPSWETIAPERFSDPAIAFPPNQAHMLGPRTSATGFLVSITRRVNGDIWARNHGQVIVSQLPPERMSWGPLIEMRGVMAVEMRAGLMGRLWNRRQGAGNAGPGVIPVQVHDTAPQWRINGASLSDELDNMFSAGVEIPMSQTWHLHE